MGAKSIISGLLFYRLFHQFYYNLLFYNNLIFIKLEINVYTTILWNR